MTETPRDVSHPFHPLGAPPLLSREALREHFAGGPQPYQGPTLRRQPTRINVHETTDPEVIVAEFQYEGTVVETGEPFTIPAVFVMRVRDGKIVESRDCSTPHQVPGSSGGGLPQFAVSYCGSAAGSGSSSCPSRILLIAPNQVRAGVLPPNMLP